MQTSNLKGGGGGKKGGGRPWFTKRKGGGMEVVAPTSQDSMSSRLPGVLRTFDDDEDEDNGNFNTGLTKTKTENTVKLTSQKPNDETIGKQKKAQKKKSTTTPSASIKKELKKDAKEHAKATVVEQKPPEKKNVKTPSSASASASASRSTLDNPSPPTSSSTKIPPPKPLPSPSSSIKISHSTPAKPSPSSPSPSSSSQTVDRSKDRKDDQIQTHEGLPTMYTISNEEQLERFFTLVCNNEQTTSNKKGKRFDGMVFGFDVEFTREKTVATIQLSTRSLACVIQAGLIVASSHQRQLTEVGEGETKEAKDEGTGEEKERKGSLLPSSLHEFLENERTTKLGVGVHGDAEAIYDTFGIKCGGLVDISVVAIKQGISHGYRSLKLLAQDLLQVEKGKSTGGWMRQHLSSEQVRYAAMDAWLGIELGWTLFDYLKLSETQPFFLWTLKNQTSLQDLEDLNLQHAIPLPFIPPPSEGDTMTLGGGIGQGQEHGSGQGQGHVQKHLDRFQRERMEKREKKAMEGYHRKRLEARKKHNQYISAVETSISSLVSNMKRKKEEDLEEALKNQQNTKKPKLDEEKKQKEEEKKKTTLPVEEEDEDSGMMLANFIC